MLMREQAEILNRINLLHSFPYSMESHRSARLREGRGKRNGQEADPTSKLIRYKWSSVSK